MPTYSTSFGFLRVGNSMNNAGAEALPRKWKAEKTRSNTTLFPATYG